MYSVDTGDGFVIKKFDDKLAGTLSIRKTGDFFATIGTASIGDGRAVSICA